MMIGIIKNLYRKRLPASVRYSPQVAKLKARLLRHDWIYSADYYAGAVEVAAARSAGRIADSILNDFKASSIVDVGCGTGALLEACRDRGCEVLGLEYSIAALMYCRSRRLNVAKFDIKRTVFADNRTFDVAVSMEVAEHLPRRFADRYVDLLTHLSPVIVLTAAPPGQGGTNHVNEQPPSYWVSKFQQRSFTHAEELSQRWRESWKAAGDVDDMYQQNLMVFRQVPWSEPDS